LTVGEVSFTSLEEGGGVFQSFTSGNETVTFAADIASSTFIGNQSGGAFAMLIDGVKVASVDFGDIDSDTTEHSILTAIVPLLSGSHELRFLITRPFISAGTSTPQQYIDDVTAEAEDESPAPEPASLTLLGIGLAGIGARCQRRSKI
jgi:hypothetical protein